MLMTTAVTMINAICHIRRFLLYIYIMYLHIVRTNSVESYHVVSVWKRLKCEQRSNEKFIKVSKYNNYNCLILDCASIGRRLIRINVLRISWWYIIIISIWLENEFPLNCNWILNQLKLTDLILMKYFGCVSSFCIRINVYIINT
jgi:uncharacterized membrane protein